MDLQKEAYPQQFQQATEIVVLLFSSHTGFVLESEMKNKFLGATMHMTFTFSFPKGLLFDHPRGRASIIPTYRKPSCSILTTHVNFLHFFWHVISCCLILLENYIFHKCQGSQQQKLCLTFLSQQFNHIACVIFMELR